jgi:homoserine O-acetyltransferase
VVPTMLARIIDALGDAASADLPHLRALSYGGGKMPQSVIELGEKFGRGLKSEKLNYDFHSVEFQVESYLRYQGEEFSGRFDANTYLLMTKALDYFDPAAQFDDDLARTFEAAKAKFCVMSFTTDWRFSPARSRELVDALMAARKDVCYLEIDAPQGHDAFLIPIPRYLQAFSNYMNRITV